MDGYEDRLPSLDVAAPVRHDSHLKLDAVSSGLLLALPTDRGRNTGQRQRSLANNGHVEAHLAQLLRESANRETPRDLDWCLALRRIPSKINNPSVEVGWELAEQPVPAMVGVSAREGPEEVVQHTLQDSP